jgi:hypothetical protein
MSWGAALAPLIAPLANSFGDTIGTAAWGPYQNGRPGGPGGAPIEQAGVLNIPILGQLPIFSFLQGLLQHAPAAGGNPYTDVRGSFQWSGPIDNPFATPEPSNKKQNRNKQDQSGSVVSFVSMSSFLFICICGCCFLLLIIMATQSSSS